jgi:hypothetical protein
MVLTAYFMVSLVIGLSCHHPRAFAEALSRVDTSVEISGRHDFAVRDTRTRLLRLLRPPHLLPDVRDDRETPLMRAEDARKSAGDLPVVTSEMICGTLARRANQMVSTNSSRRNVNITVAGALITRHSQHHAEPRRLAVGLGVGLNDGSRPVGEAGHVG